MNIQAHAHTGGRAHANYPFLTPACLHENACTCILNLSRYELHSVRLSFCLRACLSDNICPLISTCLSVCLSAHMPVCPHVSLFCLLVSVLSSDRHCLSSPQRQVLLPLRWKANENWAFRHLSWLSKSFCQTVAGKTGRHSLGVLFNTSISKAQFRRMPSKHSLMEKQTLRPIHVSEQSHRLKI